TRARERGGTFETSYLLSDAKTADRGWVYTSAGSPFGCTGMSEGKGSFSMTIRLCLFAASLLSTAVLLALQDTGLITGTVIDVNGFAVPGALVSVTNRDTNVGLKVSTGTDGIFVATPLKIGVYSVEVEAKGFKKVLRDGIQLQVQDRL